MVEGLIAFLQVLPQLLKFLAELGMLMKDRNYATWLNDATEAFRRQREAKTDLERDAANKRIIDVIRRL